MCSKFNVCFKTLIFIGALILNACGGSGGSGSNSTPSNPPPSPPPTPPAGQIGSVNDLTFISPQSLVSLPDLTTTGYIVVQNKTNKSVVGVTYSFSNIVGAASNIAFSNSNECANISANSNCVINIQVPKQTVAGSFSISASNKTSSESTLVKSSLPIGIQEIKYTNTKNISLIYPDLIKTGTSSVLITGVVQSNYESMGFNNVELVDINGNTIPNQTIISDNLGGGLTNLTQGQTFAILVSAPNGKLSSLEFKIKTSVADVNGHESNIIINNFTYTIATTNENQGILEPLTQTVYLDSNNPSQIITVSNPGNTSITTLKLQNQLANIQVSAIPTEIAAESAINLTVSLESDIGASVDSSLVLNYSHGISNKQSAVSIFQDLISPPAVAIPGLNAQFFPDNKFIKTTNNTSVVRDLVLTNTGNTLEKNISINQIPNGFILSNGTSTTPCHIGETGAVTNNLEPQASCDIRVTFMSNTPIVQTYASLGVNYSYSDGEMSSTGASFMYSVITALANIIITQSSQNFGTILNNNYESSVLNFTLNNVGETKASGLSASILPLGETPEGLIKLITPDLGSPCGDELNAHESCTISVIFGPSALTVVDSKFESANLVISYIPTEGDSPIIDTKLLTGSVVNAQSAFISTVKTDTIGFDSGNGDESLPYLMQQGSVAHISYTITNIGALAHNFYLDFAALPSGWSVDSNNCGVFEAPITLSHNANCLIKLTTNPISFGRNDINLSAIIANWNDQTNPINPISVALNGIYYINVYAPPSITISSTIPSDGKAQPGSQYSVTANLVGGNNVANQNILVKSNSSTDAITLLDNPCSISSTNPTCSSIIKVDSNIPYGSYGFDITNEDVPNLIPIPGQLSFVVTKNIIFMTKNLYNGNLGGTTGADQLCQSEAYNAPNTKIPAGLSFKALIVTSGRYPCDASGSCGDTHAKDWVLYKNESYYNSDGSLFNSVNGNLVFDGTESKFQYTNGVVDSQRYMIWTGIQSIHSNSSSSDIDAWAYADANPSGDSKNYALYSPNTCNDYTSSDTSLNSSVGSTGVNPGSRSGAVPGSTWGNYFVFLDSNQTTFIHNTWNFGYYMDCSSSLHLICVSK